MTFPGTWAGNSVPSAIPLPGDICHLQNVEPKCRSLWSVPTCSCSSLECVTSCRCSPFPFHVLLTTEARLNNATFFLSPEIHHSHQQSVAIVADHHEYTFNGTNGCCGLPCTSSRVPGWLSVCSEARSRCAVGGERCAARADDTEVRSRRNKHWAKPSPNVSATMPCRSCGNRHPSTVF
jgi:hypothetical protein